MLSDHHQIIDVTSIEGYLISEILAKKYADDFAEHSQLILYDDSKANTDFIGRTDQFSHWAFKCKASESPEVRGYIIQMQLLCDCGLQQGMKENCLGEECRFGGIYNPNSHCERYCAGCSRWFHLGCLQKMEGKPSLEMLLGHECHPRMSPHFQRFISIPIERGGLSGLVGNGRPQLQARELVSNGRKPPGDWLREIEEDYLEKQELVQLELIYFQCPTCDDRAI